MKHIIDTLIIKFLFLATVILFLYFVRKIHILLAPKDIKNHHLKFYPIKNHVDSIHFFSRLASISILLSAMSIESYDNLLENFLHFFSWSFMSVMTFSASTYILEGIVLHPFDYIEEIHKKKNYSYAIISSVLSICCATLIKFSILETSFNVVNATVSYSLLFVALIFFLKLYSKVSLFNLKSHLNKKDLSVSLSYSGFIISITTICIFSLVQSQADYQTQLLQIATKLVWSMMLFPLFRMAIVKVFKVQASESDQSMKQESPGSRKIGYGIFEGATYFMASIFTSILMPSVNIVSALPSN